MNKSRLFVFQLKEIIYTLVFIILAIILIVVLYNMFNTNNKSTISNETTNYEISYNPGIYSTQIELNNSAIDVEVCVDKNHIKSVSLTNLSDTVTTMYPLLEPSIEYIENQLQNGVSLDNIELDDASKYTQTILLDAINTSLEKAKPATLK